MNWWPRDSEAPKSSVIGEASTGTGALQAAPSAEVDRTIRASPVDASRCAQPTWTRRAFAASTETAIVGSAFVRNCVALVP